MDTSAIPEYVHDTARSLPPLPASVDRLISIAQNPDVSFNKVAEVIATDQTLTARVLRAANSPIYSPPRPVETVRQAIVVLGQEAIVNLALSISVMNLGGGAIEHWPEGRDAFWQHNIAVALLTRWLAKHLGLPAAEKLFVAGLIHDLGKVALLNHFEEQYAGLLSSSIDQPLQFAEREQFETDHAMAGAALCLHWHLPDKLTYAVAWHHDLPSEDEFRRSDAPSVSSVVGCANELVKIVGMGESGNDYVSTALLRTASHDRSLFEKTLRMLSELPQKLQAAAESMNIKSTMGAIEPVADEERPLVYLEVSRPPERDLLDVALWSLGYAPQEADKEVLFKQLFGKAEDRPTAGLITDEPLSSVRWQDFEQRDIPVLDYASWRREAHFGESTHLPVGSLRDWLIEDLAPHSLAEPLKT